MLFRSRTLDQLIAFNRAHAAEEMPFFQQETFEAAAQTKGLGDPAYKAARAKSLRLASEAIDGMLRRAGATLLVEPTYAQAWLSDPVHGDQYGGPSSSELPAIAGYPNLTVPMGLAKGLPVGLSFIATKGGEATVLVEPTYGPAWLSEPVYGDQYGGPSASELPAVAGYPNLTVPMGLVRGLPVGLSFIATRYSDGTVLNAGYAYEQRAKARVAPLYLPQADVGEGLDGRR